MVMTLMPMGARSRAMGRVIPTMPPLEAEYAAWPTWREEGEQNKEENRSEKNYIQRSNSSEWSQFEHIIIF